MGRFKFLDVAKICEVPQPGSIRSPRCLKALDGYRVNMEIALTYTTVAAFAMWMGMEWIRSGTLAANGELHTNLSKKKKIEIANLVGPLAERYMRLAVRTTRDQQLHLLVENTTMFEKFSSDAGPYAEEVMHNLLRGVVVQSWTAFEFLSEDLYDGAAQEAKAKLPLPLDKKNHPVQPGFRSRGKIREAYKAGFAADGANIISPLLDPSIDALALLRNAIVHKAAKADEDFRKGANGNSFLPNYAALQDGDPIMLDGEVVRCIVSTVIQRAYSIIEAVDVWLRTH